MHRPSWFRDGQVMISNASTCGINKDGDELHTIDHETGTRTDVIDDRLFGDVTAVLSGEMTSTVQWVPLDKIRNSKIAIPQYYDDSTTKAYRAAVNDNWPDFSSMTISELVEAKQVSVRTGHGSPSSDLRYGSVPYIKVSDLRAGQVNINSTNLVPRVVAQRYWRDDRSGLNAFDLLAPMRASKNIGEFSLLFPGQEELVLTKEILVLRPGPDADFDPFYLLWAMSLKVVRAQWHRITLMQTNREDVGDRYGEIEIPMAPNRALRDEVSEPFRHYYEGTNKLRQDFADYLSQSKQHHMVLTTET